jgi:hypothetical protein
MEPMLEYADLITVEMRRWSGRAVGVVQWFIERELRFGQSQG